MRRVAILLAVALVTISCTENEPPKQSKPVTILSPPVSAKMTEAEKAAAQKQDKAVAPTERKSNKSDKAPLKQPAPEAGTDSLVPPEGAQYTIFCARVDGDAHVQRGNKLKSELVSSTRMNGWYVIHDDSQSLLYYGFYRSFNDPNDSKESARAQADRRRIESLTDQMQNRLFPRALFVNVESPDPLAPAEWNLVNADGFWTLQIAAYKDSPQRKEAAVEAVREARAQGIDAYFYHGDSVSSVCIGAWPEQAVTIHKPTYTAHDSLVVATGDLPSEVLNPVRDKQNVQVVQDKVQIVDPTLMAAMKQYPYHAVNGMQLVQKVNGQDVPDPSLLVKIPRPVQDPGVAGGAAPPSRSGDSARQDPAQVTQDPKAQPPPRRQPAEKPGLGKLKSVGK